MIPISRLVNSSQVFSESHSLPSGWILIKWRTVSAVSGIGSWDTNSHMIFTLPGGIFVSWLVRLSSEEIMGFLIKGLHRFFQSLTNFFSSDPLSSSYLIFFIDYSSSSRRLSSPSHDSSHRGSDRSLSISNPGIAFSISRNITLSSRTVREYVAGVSDQRFYLLHAGLGR